MALVVGIKEGRREKSEVRDLVFQNSGLRVAPLTLASFLGNRKSVRILINSGANVKIWRGEFSSALL